MEILADFSDLRKVLELEKVPHYTTLQKAAKQFTNKKMIDRLLRSTLALASKARVMKKSVALSAIDSTGLESHYTSSYFVRRRTRDTKEYENTHYLYALSQGRHRLGPVMAHLHALRRAPAAPVPHYGQIAADHQRSTHDGLPPVRLHLLRNFFRSFLCNPLASACSEQALEITALSAPVGFAATAGLAAGTVLAGVCPKLIPIPAVAASTEKATTRSNLMTASNLALAFPM